MTEVAIFFGGIAVGSMIMGWVLVFSHNVAAVGVAFLISITCMVLAGICLMIERGIRRVFSRRQTVKIRRISRDRQWWRGSERGWRKEPLPEPPETFIVIEREPPTLSSKDEPTQPDLFTGRPTMEALWGPSEKGRSKKQG